VVYFAALANKSKRTEEECSGYISYSTSFGKKCPHPKSIFRPAFVCILIPISKYTHLAYTHATTPTYIYVYIYMHIYVHTCVHLHVVFQKYIGISSKTLNVCVPN